ncbi:hypothetical protein ACFSYG_19600 [Leeuwenhoekiella polynyae]|mgnify:CR=1 FL=1|uniref:Carboxypeptidase-like protein n=1 Tax=Leeuwenhoekiella polynyae TaxID=1550906 RepID=A0A4Q0PFF5_9FLAO|nr:hypothetical protein [Leeuwenhoekiella polynyae]RXG25246.1 hypothetical protein DSM02_1216 [Leeuwenhoekiella polynyae]
MAKLFGFFGILFLSCSLGLKAQEAVMLEGRIVNDSIEHEYLHILNLTLQKGTITSESGNFAIPVRVNDTLYISALQFKHKELVITPAIYSRKYIEIALETEVTELADVNISDVALSGRLGDDMNKPKLEKPFDPAEAGLPVYTGPVLTSEERKLYTATHSGGGIIPVDAVINAISGRTAYLKKIVKVSNMEIKVQEARNLVADSTYIKQLEIPARFIDDFVHYVYMDNTANLAVAASENPLSLMELLLQEAPAYLEHKKDEGVRIEKKQ